MKKTLLAFSCFLLITLSCERPESLIDRPKKSISEPISQGSISIEEAKNYFINTVIQSTASAREGFERKYQRDIDWGSAKKIKQENGLEVIASPIIYKTNTRPGAMIWDSKTSEDKRQGNIENALNVKECFITFKDMSGNIQTQLVQYISTKEYELKHKGNISKDDFSGWVMAMTWGEQPIIGYEFKNGKDVKQLTPVNSASNSGGRVAYCEFSYYQSIAVSCYSCGSNCTACDVSVSGGYQGYCTDPSSNSGTDPNTYVSYGGNGIYYYTPPATIVEIGTYSNSPGQRPIATFSNKCDGLADLWSKSISSGREVNGVVTTDGSFLVTEYSGTHGGPFNGLYSYQGQMYYYFFIDGSPAPTYPGTLTSQGKYFIPVKATVHSHTPCLYDNTDGITNNYSQDDIDVATTYPGIMHYALGCGALGRFSSGSNGYINITYGSPSVVCASIN